jgi:hypothetical protein
MPMVCRPGRYCAGGTCWRCHHFCRHPFGQAARRGARSRRRGSSVAMPRLGPTTYAVIPNCELVMVVVVGAIVLGEKVTPYCALGGGLILAGILLHRWSASHRASNCRRARIAAQNLPLARHVYPQQPATAFETHHGRSASAAGTASRWIACGIMVDKSSTSLGQQSPMVGCTFNFLDYE